MNKLLFFVAIITATIFTACNNGKNKNTETTNPTTTSVNTQLYACSMHPEVTGKKDAECSKCGMKLTVPVKEQKKDSTASTK